MSTNRNIPRITLMNSAEKEYLCLKGIVTEYLSQETISNLRERYGSLVNITPEITECRNGVCSPVYIPADCARYIHLRHNIPDNICNEFVNKQIARYNEKCKIT